jgi:lipopolysaccharide/colanic/teichoic acid biosynthesis glycosyltransferase
VVGVKRIFDVSLSGLLLVALSPLLLVLAVVIRVFMGGPVFFRQMRPGFEERPINLVKFRTMRDSYDPNGRPLADEMRMTQLGALLRRTSLDELPELWNVLKGDMSLVGPRPLLSQYLDRYTPEQARRHEVKPGITGLAQVSGRNALSWGERLALDVWYVDHRSMRLDMKILARTMWQVLSGNGITAPGHATMPEFTGDDRG